MDTMSINDLVFECLRALVLVVLLAILFLRGNFTSLARHKGWKLIVAGFCLVTAATLLDITDEIPGMEKFIVLGDTIYEAFLEKLPGYLLGFVLVLAGFYRMIPSLQKAEATERALQESEGRFRQIFLTSPDPVVLTRLDDGVIIDVNPAFETLAGFEGKEVLGRTSLDLNLWWNPSQHEEVQRQLQESGEIRNLELDFRLRDGSRINALLSARTLQLNKKMCHLAVVRDISLIKEAEKALMETDRIRSEFVSTAAHELRTPLSVLLGYTDLLTAADGSDQFDPSQRQEFLQEIAKKGSQLNQIVDDLFDISRMTSGLTFEMKMASENINGLLKKEFENYQVQNTNRRFKLDLCPKETFISCDVQRIQQVLDNLLSNAIKYSAPGSEITLTSSYGDKTFQFSVRDNGQGMTEEVAKRAFDKFYRADSSDTATSGLGLGLSIVKQIVEAHQGNVEIASKPDAGTIVRVNLPHS